MSAVDCHAVPIEELTRARKRIGSGRQYVADLIAKANLAIQTEHPQQAALEEQRELGPHARSVIERRGGQ